MSGRNHLIVFLLILLSSGSLAHAHQSQDPSGVEDTPKSPAHALPKYLESSNWERVQKGMSREEVLGILGEPIEGFTDQEHWFYTSANISRDGDRKTLGFVTLQTTVTSVSRPNVVDLRVEKEFWLKYGLRADLGDETSRAASAELPLWTDFSRWLRVRRGMTLDAVTNLLGPPDRTDASETSKRWLWEYGTAWQCAAPYTRTDESKLIGSVEFTAEPDGTRLVKQLESVPDIAELHRFISFLAWRKSQAGEWPKWTDPAAWFNLRRDMDPKSIEALLGTPDDKERKSDVKATLETWYFGRAWSAGKIEGHLVIRDPLEFPTIVEIVLPDWDELASAMRGRTGGLAQAPIWSNPESWLQLHGRLQMWRGAFDYTKDDLKRIGKPSRIEWSETPAPFSGLWQATWRFEDGGSIVWATYQPISQPQPTSNRGVKDGYITSVIPPAAGTTKDLSRLSSWKRLAGQLSSTEMVPSAQMVWDEIDPFIGRPEREEHFVGKVVRRYKPNAALEPEMGYSAPMCRAHYGDGFFTLAQSSDPFSMSTEDEFLPLGNSVDVCILQFKIPSDASMRKAASNHSWPSYAPETHKPDAQGRPHFLDLSRWSNLKSGDSLAWAIYLLGQPTSVEEIDFTKDEDQRRDVKLFMYGPWKNDSEKWKAGRFEVQHGYVGKITPPQLVTD